MAKFLDDAKIACATPKLVETNKGYIFNGTFYDKKTLIAESLEDLATHGGSKSLSLNRVASYPVIDGEAPNASPRTFFKGDAIIKDEYDTEVYYTITFDYESELNKGNKFITKYRENENGVEKILSEKAAAGSNTYYYGYLSEYIGQSKTNLYFISELSYIGTSTSHYKWNRTWIAVVDKTTLMMSLLFETEANRSIYSKILESGNMIYLLKRRSATASEIIEFEKDTHITRLIKTLPAYTGELDVIHYCTDAIMISDNKGYLIDVPVLNNNSTLRWIEFTTEEFHPAVNKNGYPGVQNLKVEDNYKVNSYSCYSNYSPCPLFDKENIAGTSYGNSSTFYWNNTSCYLDVTFNEEVNIWRAGCTSYANASYSNPFIIKKWEESTSTWDIITSSVTQKVNPINSTTWEKTIENLPEGRYRFEIENGKYRIDSCWYVEAANSNEYLTRCTLGIKEEASVSYEDIQFNVSCDIATLKDAPAGSWRVGVNSFFNEVNGTKYLNFATFGLSKTEWNSTYAENSHITTFKIDEANKELTLTGQCFLSNSQQICKSYALNSSNTRLVGMSSSNTFILDFDSIAEHFTPTKYFAFDSWSCGFDKKDNVWILKKDMELLKIHDSIPEKIEIEFEDYSLEYEGQDIKTNIFIEALNFLNNRLTSKVALKINGQAIFDESGTNEIIVETLEADKITVPLTVKGSGILMIYPTLILDIKEN